ncbi:MAG: NAD(P)-dependent oxidoreductase [Chloroflexi bacterium]|nr:NAD(P)-dependent oxidoreductase [Chloroflexota bacterium]
MRVIVTGGSGRVGQYVVRELASAGHEVVSLDRVRADGLSAQTILLDLQDGGEVYDVIAQVQPEGVCHVAANPSPSGFARNGTFANNVLSTFHVFQAAGDLAVRRFIYASSEMATGWLTPATRVPPHLPFAERDRVPSGNVYALSKYVGEVIADGMAERYPNMSVCSLRINNVIMPETYHVLKERRQDPRRGMSNFWSYIDVRDVATAFRAALEGNTTGHEMFLIAAADTSASRPIEELMAEYFDGYHSFAPGYGGFQSAFDCTKMRETFGWQPRYSWRKITPEVRSSS